MTLLPFVRDLVVQFAIDHKFRQLLSSFQSVKL